MKKILIRLGFFSIGSLGSAVLNLVLLPVTTTFLSPEEYGKTSMFFLAQTFLIYVIYLGFDQAFTREYHDYENKKALLQQAMMIPLIGAIVLAMNLVLYAKHFSLILFEDPSYTHAIYMLALSAIFLIFERFILLNLRMQNKAFIFSVYSILVKLIILLFTLLFLYFGSPTFITVVYGMLVGQILGDCVLIIGNSIFFYPLVTKIDKTLLKNLYRFGLPTVIGTFLYSLLTIIDKVMLRHFADFASLGIYTAAFKVASALMVLQVSFANFWIPTAYEWYKKNKPLFYYERVSHLMMFLLSFCFLFMVLFKEGIVLLLSSEYSEAQYLFPLLSFYPLMMTISETTNLGIVFSKKSQLNIAASLVAVLAAGMTHLLLVPLLGATGAAIATGFGYLLFFFSRTYFSMKHWEGFSVKRQVSLALLLYVFALFTAFNRIFWLEKGLVLLLMCIVLIVYRHELKIVKTFVQERKIREV
ncbi:MULTISPECIES: lipopolysaccharide biosynthesis protein [unclassified Enterococcus]|uniref:lipopolysaccharide biosynthesis protein n=1 Tax=unclassified Enterococcus TaxID=2608891 RepID=UPI001A9AEE8E|nr:oligosaccharide flippase family protein [Enterococcus sp. DIV1271a]MBO1298678.1 oligosaccharide flippase family protein [Enterococcus sp. DIV1271a]